MLKRHSNSQKTPNQLEPHHQEVRILSVSYCDNSNKKSKKSYRRKDTEENLHHERKESEKNPTH